jgi:hypothetical protein
MKPTDQTIPAALGRRAQLTTGLLSTPPSENRLKQRLLQPQRLNTTKRPPQRVIKTTLARARLAGNIP